MCNTNLIRVNGWAVIHKENGVERIVNIRTHQKDAIEIMQEKKGFGGKFRIVECWTVAPRELEGEYDR